MEHWANAWIIHKGAQGNVDELTVAYDGEKNGATFLAKADDVVFVFCEDRDASFAIGNLQFFLSDTGKSTER
jgi:hypothetical protein